MAIYVRHIELKFQGHRTLISTMHKPWWFNILWWLKPVQVDYVGCGTMWHCISANVKVPGWLSKQLQQYERDYRIKKHNTKILKPHS